MSEVRLVARLIVVFVLASLIASCARPAVEPDPPNPIRPLAENPCEKGNPREDKQGPVVCIDDSARKLVAKPDRIRVHESKKGEPTKPVQIQWYTTSGTGDVHVKMEEGCRAVNLKTCNGKGKCEAETAPGVTTECKYDVWITGGKHDLLDPTVVVDACCS